MPIVIERCGFEILETMADGGVKSAVFLLHGPADS
jgi:hypothetical protein